MILRGRRRLARGRARGKDAGVDVVRSNPAHHSRGGEQRDDAVIAAHGKAHKALLSDQRQHAAHPIVDAHHDNISGGNRAQWQRFAQFFVDGLDLFNGGVGGNGDILDGPQPIVHEGVAQFAGLEQEVEMAAEMPALRSDLPQRTREAAASTLARLIENALKFTVDAVVGGLEAVDARAFISRSGRR